MLIAISRSIARAGPMAREDRRGQRLRAGAWRIRKALSAIARSAANDQASSEASKLDSKNESERRCLESTFGGISSNSAERKA